MSWLLLFPREPREQKGILTFDKCTIVIPSADRHFSEIERFRRAIVIETNDKVEFVFKSQLGDDFAPTITSAHDSFDKHDRWSKHRTGRAVDIRLNDLPLKEKRRVVKILQGTLPKEYKVEWESQGTVNEHLHFQSKH